MRRSMVICLVLILCLTFTTAQANIFDDIGDAWDSATDWVEDTANDVGDWVSDAATDVGDWVSNAATDTADWVSTAATDSADWVVQAAKDTGNFVAGAATDGWNGVSDFFAPPSAIGNPNVPSEPDYPEGTTKMYLGFEAKRMKDKGYSEAKEIVKGDPHFGWTLGKFYVTGYTTTVSKDGKTIIFLKTLGDDVQLHFHLVQDIDMLDKDTLRVIYDDKGAHDEHFGIKATDMGRGMLIIRHTDYQNRMIEEVPYKDYLAAKMTGEADTVISLNEEGDYEIALDYMIRDSYRILGTRITNHDDCRYQILGKFSVRNGNCMVFPFDLETGEELRNTAVAKNGFRLDLARSRFLDINVKLSTLTEGAGGLIEDVRFNKPAKDGDEYTQEGIYTITVKNEYTNQETTKILYVGDNEKLMDYVNKGYTVDQIVKEADDI